MKPEKVGSKSEELIAGQKQDCFNKVKSPSTWEVGLEDCKLWVSLICITGLRPVNKRLSENSKKERGQTWVAHTFNPTSREVLSFNKPGTRECKLNPK